MFCLVDSCFQRLSDLQLRSDEEAERRRQLNDELRELKAREAVAVNEVQGRDVQCRQLSQQLTTVERALESTKAESDARNERCSIYASRRCSVMFIALHLRLHEAITRCQVWTLNHDSCETDILC